MLNSHKAVFSMRVDGAVDGAVDGVVDSAVDGVVDSAVDRAVGNYSETSRMMCSTKFRVIYLVGGVCGILA